LGFTTALSSNITSTNPVVVAIINGTAPPPAKLAAARGLLPLPQNDLLEVLVALTSSDDPELSSAAQETLADENPNDRLPVAKAEDTAPRVLAYLATRVDAGRAIHEATVLNTKTPDDALAKLATTTKDSSLLELIAINQQRLVRFPGIIEAILGNDFKSAEAERRARETQKEFFEKERGARQIADELRARGNVAAAEFFESAQLTNAAGEEMSLDDAWLIASHIEVFDDDIDDSWLPEERFEEIVSETLEQSAANIQRILESEKLDGGEVTAERVSLVRRLMLMSTRDRIKLGIKGDREARSILIRDSNKMVSSAVLNNPRITEQEVENIASMRTISDEALRLISLNRAWTRSYTIIHNLAKNPRTPVPTVLDILLRIRTKDLQGLSQNRNVSDAVRRQAARLAQVRSGK